MLTLRESAARSFVQAVVPEENRIWAHDTVMLLQQNGVPPTSIPPHLQDEVTRASEALRIKPLLDNHAAMIEVLPAPLQRVEFLDSILQSEQSEHVLHLALNAVGDLSVVPMEQDRKKLLLVAWQRKISTLQSAVMHYAKNADVLSAMSRASLANDIYSDHVPELQEQAQSFFFNNTFM